MMMVLSIEVANELNSQKDQLVSYAISNPNNFHKEINEIVKIHLFMR